MNDPTHAPSKTDTSAALSQLPAGDIRNIPVPSIIFQNIRQNIIQIPEDRLKLNAQEYLRRMDQGRGWLVALTILLPVALTLTTANFHAALGIGASTWQAVYLIVGGLAFLYLLNCLVNMGRRYTIDNFIDKCKRGEPD